jgi:hypothetical protein
MSDVRESDVSQMSDARESDVSQMFDVREMSAINRKLRLRKFIWTTCHACFVFLANIENFPAFIFYIQWTLYISTLLISNLSLYRTILEARTHVLC